MARPKTAVSKSEIAAILKVSPGRISQLCKQGMPVQKDGRVNIEAAQASFAKNVTKGGRKRGPRPSAAPAPKSSPGSAAETTPAEDEEITLEEATRLLEIEKLRKLRSENDRAEGRNLDAEDVRRTWERHRDAVKNRLLLVSSKVPANAREKVDLEIRAALTELSGEGAADETATSEIQN